MSRRWAAAGGRVGRAGVHPARRKVLESLRDHWTGLTVFVDHPEVPMDNNTAERSERGPVVGRKNYYGSGAVWSGRLAAMLFSLFQTLALWGINPRAWLTAYLTALRGGGWPGPRAAGGVVAVEPLGGPTPGLVAGTAVGRQFVVCPDPRGVTGSENEAAGGGGSRT